jgi:hypothetical protein
MSETFPLERLDAEFARAVKGNQLRLRGSLLVTYDFIVCESSSGALMAWRLVETRKNRAQPTMEVHDV